MKIFTEPQFLAKGSTQLPNYEGMRGVGIHPSSEVDSCTVAGVKLGVKAIVPVGAGAEVRADKRKFNNITFPGLALQFDTSVADNAPNAGDKLVLQIYEACDRMIPPGPRAPYLSRASSSGLPGTKVLAAPMFKLPTSGRTRIALSWMALNIQAIVNVSGVRMTYGVQPLTNDGRGTFGYVISNTTDYNSPATAMASAGPSQPAVIPTRTIYIDNESFDYLLVWAWDLGNSGGNYFDILAEVSGERI